MKHWFGKGWWILLVGTLLSAGLTDDAYRLYKKGEYENAFHLYWQAYREEGSVKGAYNMAVLIEKRKVHDRNILNYAPKEAAKWYRVVADSVPGASKLSPKQCGPMYRYYLRSFDKLSDWYRRGYLLPRSAEKSRYYAHKAEELRGFCRGSRKKPSGSSKPLSEERKRAEAFVAKCPAAAVVPARDRIGIEHFDCGEFRRFPRQMKKILHLAQEERIYRNPSVMDGSGEEKRRIINRKARKIARPILLDLLRKETASCIERASSASTVNRCMKSYLGRCRQLTFGPVISCIKGGSASSTKQLGVEEARKEARKWLEERRRKGGDLCPVLVRCD
ncbi:hypothetical protein [Nitratifractor sp.]